MISKTYSHSMRNSITKQSDPDIEPFQLKRFASFALCCRMSGQRSHTGPSAISYNVLQVGEKDLIALLINISSITFITTIIITITITNLVRGSWLEDPVVGRIQGCKA